MVNAGPGELDRCRHDAVSTPRSWFTCWVKRLPALQLLLQAAAARVGDGVELAAAGALLALPLGAQQTLALQLVQPGVDQALLEAKVALAARLQLLDDLVAVHGPVCVGQQVEDDDRRRPLAHLFLNSHMPAYLIILCIREYSTSCPGCQESSSDCCSTIALRIRPLALTLMPRPGSQGCTKGLREFLSPWVWPAPTSEGISKRLHGPGRIRPSRTCGDGVGLGSTPCLPPV